MKLSTLCHQQFKCFATLIVITLLSAPAVCAQQPSKPTSNVDPLGILDAPSAKEKEAPKTATKPTEPQPSSGSKSTALTKTTEPVTPKSAVYSASLDGVLVGGGLTASWIRGTSIVPTNAVIAGNENGAPLYACRANHNGGLHPGKVVGESCNFGYGGKEIVSKKFDVLVGGGTWERVHSNLESAYPAGAEKTGETLYLCRGEYQGGIHPGKLVAGKCNIGYGRKEISLTDYEVFYASPK